MGNTTTTLVRVLLERTDFPEGTRERYAVRLSRDLPQNMNDAANIMTRNAKGLPQA